MKSVAWHGKEDVRVDDVSDPRIEEPTDAIVRRWVPELLPLLTDEDPLGVDDLATHEAPLEQAPELYEKFQKKHGCIKIVLHP